MKHFTLFPRHAYRVDSRRRRRRLLYTDAGSQRYAIGRKLIARLPRAQVASGFSNFKNQHDTRVDALPSRKWGRRFTTIAFRGGISVDGPLDLILLSPLRGTLDEPIFIFPDAARRMPIQLCLA